MPILVLLLTAQDVRSQFVDVARSFIGTPYRLGGRMRSKAEGLDCQGVLFFAAQAVSGCGWKSFSVFPTEAAKSGELGWPVAGLSPIASGDLAIAELQLGDILWLVSPYRNPKEEPIAQLRGRPVWVLHTGVYSGEGRWIVGDHYAGQVSETNLMAYLAAHHDMYTGLFVLRMQKGPSPTKCKKR